MASDNKIEILMTRFFSGEAQPEEAMQLEDWANISPANKAHFNACSKFFVPPIELTNGDSKQLVWENIKAVVAKNDESSKAKIINWRLARIAVSIVLILSISFLLKHILKKEKDINVYQAQASTKMISLKDSTEITLLPNSNMTTDKEYGITNRKIKLTGSAHFSIIHNAGMPFLIDMNKLYIKDLGTAFSIVTSPTGDTIFINVIEGRITVYDDFGSSGNISKGEKAIYIKSQTKLQVLHIEQAKRIFANDSKKRNLETNDPDTAIKRNAHLMVSISDLSSGHKPDKVYTPGGKPTLMSEDSTATIRIINDMHKDGLIRSDETVFFKLSNKEFILNGKIQVDSIFLKYKKKYAPPVNADKDWSWCHNLNCRPVKN